MENLASISFSKRDFKQAENLLQKSLALKEKILGADHPDVATALHNLANVYQRDGKYETADPMYLRSYSIRESKLGLSHPDSIQVLKDYACSHMKSPASGKKPDQNGLKLLGRATCLFAGLNDNCKTDGVLNGQATLLVTPKYPQGAQVTQMIYVYIRVNEEGKIVSASAPCGSSLLAKAAIDAAWQAKFKPRLVNGKPVEVNGVLIYNFVHQ